MTNLLIRAFIKKPENTSDPAVRRCYGNFAGVVGIATNLVLFIIKIIVGTLSGSIAITADAVNNLSDSGSSLVTLVGFKISGKPADSDHPFGHGRMEYIAGLMVSFIIVIIGYQLTVSSVEKILHPQETVFSAYVVIVLAVSIAIKIWQGLFYRSIGRRIDSLTLRAASADSRNDVISTASVLTAAVISMLTDFNLDGYMGAAVGLFIVISGVKLTFETISPLLGAAPKKELVERIREKVLSYETIIGIHDLSVHDYGQSECYASLHCEVPAEQDVMVSHDIIDNIERDFLDEGIRMVIHLDPVVTGDERTNALKARIESLVKDISPHIGIHDFRVVWSITHTNLIFDVMVPYQFKWSDGELVSMITERISALDATYNAVITVDHDDVNIQ
ncbi:MAG: cation transporter [Clostridiales bacterium]|nr:cation transporter [Clostridiales bacterium]